MIRGLVLGKFLPPHAGHVHLCEVARRMCDELVVVVASRSCEPIAGAQRLAWMRELVPAARVVALADDALPQQPDDDPAFWPRWVAALAPLGPVARVFTSDAYGDRLARELGARWIPVDPTRATHAISGTALRADPSRHWAHLPRAVRPHFARRVSVFGPESTGKSTLAAALAARLDTVAAPEFARTYLEAHAITAPSRDDLELVASGQAALEDALALDCNRTLVCDTDPLLTVVWSEVLFGTASPAVRAAAATRAYAHTLLLDVDLPWVPDPVRYLPTERATFFARCAAALDAARRPYTVIRGAGDARLAAALAALELP